MGARIAFRTLDPQELPQPTSDGTQTSRRAGALH